MQIIAEIGQNHNGDLELACELIKKAKICGADVAKFQLYDAKNLFPKEGNEWYEYNCKTELSFEDVEMLDRVCHSKSINFSEHFIGKIEISIMSDKFHGFIFTAFI